MRPVLRSFGVRALLVIASIAISSGVAPPRHAASAPTYGVAVLRDVMIPAVTQTAGR